MESQCTSAGCEDKQSPSISWQLVSVEDKDPCLGCHTLHQSIVEPRAEVQRGAWQLLCHHPVHMLGGKVYKTDKNLFTTRLWVWFGYKEQFMQVTTEFISNLQHISAAALSRLRALVQGVLAVQPFPALPFSEQPQGAAESGGTFPQPLHLLQGVQLCSPCSCLGEGRSSSWRGQLKPGREIWETQTL